MSEWRDGFLSEIADIIMGQSPSGETCNSKGNGLPLLNGPTEFGKKYPSPIQFTTDARKICQENDILFCVRGSTTGRMNWANGIYAIGRGLAAIRHQNGAEYQHFVKGIIDYNLPGLLANATGSTFPNVSKDQLEKLDILIPPLLEQKAIAEVLSCLDDKIDLLHRQNKTLETLAETLFRQWFIEESSEEWEVKKISDIAKHIKVNLKPMNNPEALFYHYSLPAFDTGKRPYKEFGVSILSNKYQVLPNSILVSKLNPKFPRIWAVGDDVEKTRYALQSFKFLYRKIKVFLPFFFFYLNLMNL